MISKRKANVNRLRKVLYLRQKNINLSYDIGIYISAISNTDDAEFLRRLQKNINICGSSMLLHDKDSYLEFITTNTCKHKLCSICNSQRKSLLRKKYILFFRENPTLFIDATDNTVKTASNCIQKGTPVEYNLMHLTLTVPHAKGYYKGRKLYYDTLIRDFNTMRKKPRWKEFVYGGECGIETTKNENGLHIHIHALLMVRSFTQNRNVIHREILLMWNSITNDIRQIEDFTLARIAAIKKGNTLITDKDVESLKRGGATLIGLENIYVKDKTTGKKMVANNEESRVKAVLETISYHFKPNMFDRGDGHFDVEMLAEIYKNMKNKKLYQKFGVLQHEKLLNLSLKNDMEDFTAAKEVEKGLQQDQPESTQSLGYYYTRSRNVYIKNGKIMCGNKSDVINLNTNSTKNALKILFQNNIKSIS